MHTTAAVTDITLTIPGPLSGTAASIDEAKDRFKAAWVRYKNEHGDAVLTKAHEAMPTGRIGIGFKFADLDAASFQPG